MVFGEVISVIEAAFSPKYMELALADAVADPVKTHVNCLGPFLLDSVIGDASSSAIVSLDGCGWLRVAEFF